MTYRFAHIINPVIVPSSSDLFVAQPITFESIRIAKKLAMDDIDVSVYTAQFPEDQSIIPSWFEKTPDLTRSALDFVQSRKQRKLPLIGDILERLHQAADADYLIYSNVDISVQPFFYVDFLFMDSWLS